MEYFVPRQPDPFIKRARDQELAKFGHLNALVREINSLTPGAGVVSIVAGTNISVDNTDPQNPVVSATGGGSQNLSQVLAVAPAGDAGNLPATNFSDISLTGTLYDEGGAGFTILTAGALSLNIGTASTWTFNSDLIITGAANIDMSGVLGSLLINKIADGGGNIVISQTSSGGTLTLQTADDDLNILIGPGGVMNMNGNPTHTGTVDVTATPNLVFENGVLMSAS